MIKRKPEDYTSNYMTRDHQPITKLETVMKKYSYNNIFLFYKGVKIGEGEICGVSRKNKSVHTEGMSLEKKYRRKGHGIFLYHHIISAAVRVGAKRIYSSETLNKFSRNMWSTKLPKFYKVVVVNTKKACCECGCRQQRPLKYYIDL